jgi:hypothetical protein
MGREEFLYALRRDFVSDPHVIQTPHGDLFLYASRRDHVLDEQFNLYFVPAVCFYTPRGVTTFWTLPRLAGS